MNFEKVYKHRLKIIFEVTLHLFMIFSKLYVRKLHSLFDIIILSFSFSIPAINTGSDIVFTIRLYLTLSKIASCTIIMIIKHSLKLTFQNHCLLFGLKNRVTTNEPFKNMNTATKKIRVLRRPSYSKNS